MAIINFIFRFIACNAQFVGIDYNDIIAGINVRCINGFMFAASTVSNLRSKAAQNFTGRVNDKPVMIYFVWFG